VTTLVGARFPSVFAAMVPIAGVYTNPGMAERCDSIAAHNLPVWAFHNLDDPLSDVHSAEQFVNLIKEHSPLVSPRLTIFDVYGHDAWTTALNPSYRENGMNIYEWMLQYSR
jgi:predicted peptidase